MEKFHTTEFKELDITEEENDEFEVEKTKKSKKFLSFFVNLISSRKSHKDKEKIDGEERQEPLIDYLAIIKGFQSRQEDDELDSELDSSELTEESSEEHVVDEKTPDLDQMRDIVGEEFEETITKLGDPALSDLERETVLANAIILEQINDDLVKGKDIDIDEIVTNTEAAKQSLAQDQETVDRVLDRPEKSKEPSEKIKKFVVAQANEPRVVERSPNFESAKPDSIVSQPEILSGVTSLVADKVELGQPPEFSKDTSQTKPNAPLPIIGGENLEDKPKIEKHEEVAPTHVESVQKVRQEELINEVLKSKEPIPKTERIVNQPENKITYVEPSKPKNSENRVEPIQTEQINNREVEQNKSAGTYSELLQEAGKVLIDGVSLRRIFENSHLTKDDLRSLLEIKRDKKKLRKQLDKSLKRRHDNYELISNKIHGLIYGQPNHQLSQIPASVGQEMNINKLAGSNVQAEKNKFVIAKNDNHKSRSTINHPFITIAVLILLFAGFLFYLILKRHKP